jgi:hypothetical protein
MMNETGVTDRVVAQGRALTRAIDAMTEIEPSGWFERALACLLLASYRRRLRGIVEAVPDWTKAEILGAPPAIRWTDD